MDDAVILIKRKDEDLALLLETNSYGKIGPNISRTIIGKNDEKYFAPGVSFEIVEAYLKYEKHGYYGKQERYQNRVLKLNNPKTIESLLDFLQKATKMQNLKETDNNQEQQKEIDAWEDYLKTIHAYAKK